MLRRDPRPRRSGPSRLRLRRRLLLFSAPLAVGALLIVLKLTSVVLVGNSAVSAFDRRDIEALRGDVSTLSVVNVVEPAKAPFAAGALAVLDGRLADADAAFTEALSRTGAAQSCAVRINLELVRETQGDLAARDGRTDQAAERYTSALTVANDAPGGCFPGNDDPDPDRREVRNQTTTRLADKLNALRAPRPPAPPGMTVAPPPPPPPLAASGAPPPVDPKPPVLGPAGPGMLTDTAPDRLPSPGAEIVPEHRLDPGSSDPLDRLRQVLQDAASSGDNSEAG
jgi:hypothetical protein